MWLDAGVHGEYACMNKKAWGGLVLPEELDGVEAEDDGGSVVCVADVLGHARANQRY